MYVCTSKEFYPTDWDDLEKAIFALTFVTLSLISHVV